MAKETALDTIRSERAKLEAALSAIVERERAAEDELRDSGRTALLAALGKVKIGAMERQHAKAIAASIAKHGGTRVAAALETLGS